MSIGTGVAAISVAGTESRCLSPYQPEEIGHMMQSINAARRSELATLSASEETIRSTFRVLKTLAEVEEAASWTEISRVMIVLSKLGLLACLDLQDYLMRSHSSLMQARRDEEAES